MINDEPMELAIVTQIWASSDFSIVMRRPIQKDIFPNFKPGLRFKIDRIPVTIHEVTDESDGLVICLDIRYDGSSKWFEAFPVVSWRNRWEPASFSSFDRYAKKVLSRIEYGELMK